jgi:uncharacterized protein YoxC
MTLLALTGGEVALIVLAAGWVLLVAFLCYVLLKTSDVLAATRHTIDAMREETVPLLREVKGSVERTNAHLERLGGILDAATGIVRRVERVSGLVERAVSNPLVKIVGVGAGLRGMASRFGKGRSGGPPSAGATAP